MTAAAALLAAALALPARAQSLSADPLDQALRIPRIDFGPLQVSDDHPAFDLADFPVSVEGSSAGVSARWADGAVRYVRAPDGLAVPLARLRVSAAAAPERLTLHWRRRAVPFQADGDGAAVEVFVPPLEAAAAQVDLDGRPVAVVRASARPAAATPPERRHGIDHSCSPWGLALRGLGDVFATASCRLILVGRLGSESPFLEVRWSAAGVTLPDGSSPPLTAELRDARPARLTLLGPDGKPRAVELAASVPPRWHRVRLSWGAGPYSLVSSARAGNGGAGSLMLYGNLSLRPEGNLSLRVFEAAVSKSPAYTAFFNNLGVYFAHDLARVWDTRLRLTALLGMQGVTFSPAGLSGHSYNEALFPQGFELAYADAFGLRNKTLSGGMFLQPVANKHYDNLWVRFGGRWFAELNYLAWRSGDRFARMSGFSVGMPFSQLW